MLPLTLHNLLEEIHSQKPPFSCIICAISLKFKMEKKKPGDCQIKEMKGAASKEDVKLKIEQVSLCLPRKSLSQITDTDFAETIETGNNNAWLVVSEA